MQINPLSRSAGFELSIIEQQPLYAIGRGIHLILANNFNRIMIEAAGSKSQLVLEDDSNNLTPNFEGINRHGSDKDPKTCVLITRCKSYIFFVCFSENATRV